MGNGGSIMELLQEIVSSVKEEKRKKMVQVIAMLTSWCLWMNRNNKMFKRIAGSESKVIDEVKEISYMWLKYRVMMESVSWEMWCRGNLEVNNITDPESKYWRNFPSCQQGNTLTHTN
ncbi:hypothetical protein R6Q57_009347 [Mikania cordata]